MRWSKKGRRAKEVKMKEEPKLGDFKRRVWFAVFPVKVEDKWLWWEKYIKVSIYKRNYRTEEYTVSSGLLEDAFTTTGLVNRRTVSDTVAYESWCYHSREFYVA